MDEVQNPVAWSVDGSTFEYLAPIEAEVPLGACVVIGDDSIGQVLSRTAGGSEGGAPVRSVAGTGRLLVGRSSARGQDAGFAATSVRMATAGEVAAAGILDVGEGAMHVGTVHLGDGDAEAVLRPSGFTRHTFLCGQSGSGKTYAMGTILERIVAQTSLRMIVLDPNGDYRNLATPREGSDGAAAELLRAASPKVRVHAEGTEDGAPRIRIADLSVAAQMAALRLDPIRDSAEIGALVELKQRRSAGEDPRVLMEWLNDPGNENPLSVRVRALGLGTWDTWALDRRSVVDAVEGTDDVHVIDVSGVNMPQEMYAIAAAVLDRLWERRTDRIPTLIAIDEAHNLCTESPEDPLQRHVTERLVQIAGEGRKFGLHLLMATQRPAKLHVNVMSQCDNLVLLRMNSAGDLEEIRRLFGFAPLGLIERSTSFVQGQALVAGPISPVPQLLRFGGRVSEEGGSDIPVDWVHPRSS